MNGVIAPVVSAAVAAIAALLGAWIFARSRSGRTERNLEQGAKLVDFVSRYCECYSGVDKLPDAAKNEAERLLVEIMQGVREDLAAERALLPQFEQVNSSLRHALLLTMPRGPVLFLMHLAFYTLMLFVPFVFAARYFSQQRVTVEDFLAIIACVFLAGMVRLAVALASRKRATFQNSI